MSRAPFPDRLAALVEERRSQVCLGLDPDPAHIQRWAGSAWAPASGARLAEEWCREIIDLAAAACIAVKPQLACFERLGPEGLQSLFRVCERARERGLLVIADGKRGDVPVTANVYASALFEPEGLGADAATVNPLLGRDAVEPFVEYASRQAAGVFVLVRTSNPGAADFQDLVAGGRPLHEHFAQMVREMAPALDGTSHFSGVGAVVGATAPDHLERLRELMPMATLLLPGVGAQGGAVSRLGPAFQHGASGGIVTASRSIANDSDPARAAATLRDAVWQVSRGKHR